MAHAVRKADKTYCEQRVIARINQIADECAGVVKSIAPTYSAMKQDAAGVPVNPLTDVEFEF